MSTTAPKNSTAPKNNKTVTELDEALRLLDYELEGLNMKDPIQVRAIGGFAMLKHGIRSGDRAFTVDIDSVTRDYEAAVIQAIATVAERAGLDNDWLNNYNVMDNDPGQVESMIGAEWIIQKVKLKNIEVSIATIETLTRAKIIAVDNMEFSEREQDLPDLAELLAHQGIKTMQQFRTKYPDPYGEYPDAAETINKQLGAVQAAGAAKVAAFQKKHPELRTPKAEPEPEWDDNDYLGLD